VCVQCTVISRDQVILVLAAKNVMRRDQVILMLAVKNVMLPIVALGAHLYL